MKKIYLPLFLLFQLAVFPVNAQMTPKQKDSILQIYPSVSGVEKLQLTDKLVNYYTHNQLDSAKYYNDILLQEDQRQGNRKYEGLYYHNLGVYYAILSKHDDAIRSFKQAIAIQKPAQMLNDLADTYNDLAGSYYYLENYEKAAGIIYKTIKIYETQNNYKGIISSLHNLGVINSTLGNLDEALKNYKKAINIINTKNILTTKSDFYSSIGVAFKKKSVYDSALYYYQKSIAIDKKNNVKRGLAHTYYDLANLYAFYLKNKDSANYYYQKSLNYANKYDKNLLLSIQSAQAKMLMETGRTNEGLALMNEVLQSAKLKDDKEIKELAYFKLYDVYKKQHKWQSALKNLEDLMDIQDTIDRENTKLKIAKLEAKYQNEKKQAKIDQLELKQKLDKKIKTYLTLAIALLFLSFALIGYNFINKQKRNRLEKELLKTEKEKLHQDVRFKTKQLTSQALMMMQKNKLIDDILSQLSTIKGAGVPLTDLNKLKRKLKKSLHSEDDWELFKHYFEEINKNFFKRLKQINPKITPAEQRLAALVKLRFNIKETAELLNISPDSVKTARSQLRKKMGLAAGKNMYEFLNQAF